MTMTWDDVARDMALQELHDEAVMKQATRKQCVFLFVEGDSEEGAFRNCCMTRWSSNHWGFK